MKVFHKFRIDFWEKLGFRFRLDKGYPLGEERMWGYANLGHYSFTLLIAPTHSIAAIENNETEDHEKHGASETEALEWFCSKSTQFRDLYVNILNTEHKALIERIPAGKYYAYCFQLLNLGLRTKQGDFEPSFTPRIILGWELHSFSYFPESKNLSSIYRFYKEYSLTLPNLSYFQNDIGSWLKIDLADGYFQTFEFDSLLGTWCEIELVDNIHKSSEGYRSLKISPLPTIAIPLLTTPRSMVKHFDINALVDYDLIYSLDEYSTAQIFYSNEWRFLYSD